MLKEKKDVIVDVHTAVGGELDPNKNAGTVTHKTNKSTGNGKGGVGVTDGKVLTPSYGGDTNGSDKEAPEGKSTIEGSKELEYEKPSDDTSKIEAITDDNTNKKDDKEDKREQVISDDEMKNAPDNTSDKPQEPENTYKGPEDGKEDFLDKYGKDDKSQDDKDNKSDDKKDEQKDNTPEEVKYTPVSIKAESDSAIAGDTVRFDITGDVEKISGYPGITVDSIKNGSVTIDTPAGKTQTITLEVVGKDGSKCAAKILIRSLEDQIKLIDGQEDNKTDDKDNTNKEDEKPTEDTKPVSYKAVSVRVDSGDIYVGDTIQFFIDGDIESITGAGKTVADVKNGTLEIKAEKVGNYTITVKGKDGSTATGSVEVKEFPWNIKEEEKVNEINSVVEEESNPQITVPTNNTTDDSKKAAEEEAAKKAAEEAAAKKAAEEEAAKKAAEEAAAKKAAEEEAARKAAEEAKKKEEATPTYAPVSITSQCGSSAKAGDQVKFNISGDVESISGTDGFATSFANGELTVYTDPDIATAITIIVKGKDGKTVQCTVMVNA